MAGYNASFSSNATVMTLQHFANEIFDNVVTNNATLNELQKAGNIYVVGGGRQFTHPIFYTNNTTFAAYAKDATITPTVQEMFTRSTWDIKCLAGAIAVSKMEEAMNAGDKEKMIDYVEGLKMAAELSMSELIGDQLFHTDYDTAENIDSIPKIIYSVPSAQTHVVGGIDGSDANATYWKNYAYTAAIAFSASGLNYMDQALNQATFGRQGPTFIITTKSIFTYYQLTLTANVRYTQLEKGDAGFRNLMYATLPVMFDDNCAANHMYFIDGKSLRLQVLAQGNMKLTPFQDSYNQLMSRALLYMYCNLTCGSRRTNAVLTNISSY